MEYPREIFNKAWELGLVNTHIPEVSYSLVSMKTLAVLKAFRHRNMAAWASTAWTV